eukprot:2009921-Amphidinium_carterae.1
MVIMQGELYLTRRSSTAECNNHLIRQHRILLALAATSCYALAANSKRTNRQNGLDMGGRSSFPSLSVCISYRSDYLVKHPVSRT